MKRHLSFTALIAIAAASCVFSCKRDMTAQAAAEHYYNRLIASDCEAWIDGTLHSEAYTDDIRQERIDMLRQYLETERQIRGGLKGAHALRDTIVDTCAYVFVELTFGDSTSEEVLVPMVLSDGVWKMK